MRGTWMMSVPTERFGKKGRSLGMFEQRANEIVGRTRNFTYTLQAKTGAERRWIGVT